MGSFRPFFLQILFPFHSLISIWTSIMATSHRSLRPSSSLFILISFCSSDWAISADLSQLFWWLCLLKSAVKLLSWIFYFSYCSFSTPKILSGYFFLIYIYLSVFSIWWDIVLTFSFSSLNVTSCNSLNIFKIVDFKCSCSNPKISNKFYWLLSSPVYRPFFLVCLHVSWCSVENWTLWIL